MVDRLDEMDRLRCACVEAPQLVVVRGRSRVGKSFLLSRAFADHRRRDFQPDEQDRNGQPSPFAREAAQIVLSGGSPNHMRRLLEADRRLYGRAGSRPLLEPLDVRRAARFSDSGEPDELRRRYAAPQHQVWAGRGPVREAIATRILMKGSRFTRSRSTSRAKNARGLDASLAEVATRERVRLVSAAELCAERASVPTCGTRRSG